MHLNIHCVPGRDKYVLPDGVIRTQFVIPLLPCRTQENSIVLNGSVMFSPSRIPNSFLGGEPDLNERLERYKLCMCADGTLFRVQVKYPNMGCQTTDNPCGVAH